jgi:hypothetical protein
MLTPVLLPLEGHIPAVGGFGFMWFVFAVLAGYVLVKRLAALNAIWLHPLFSTAYAMLALISLIEFGHTGPSYHEIFRSGQTIVGAVFVASLCRDRQALQATMYGFICSSLWLSTLLFTTSYGALSGATASNFQEANLLRGAVLANNPLDANANRMAGEIALGTPVALACALTASRPHYRYMFLGIAAFLLIGACLPMSRGGVAMTIISCAAVMFASGVRRGKIILFASVLAVTMMTLVPDALWSRMSFSTEARGGRVEARAALYTAVVENLPEYVVTGVGAGNFWESWAWGKAGFRLGPGVVGAHNVFFQFTIFWGLVGLLGLMAVIWQACRCLPRQCGKDGPSLCLLGVSTALFFLMLQQHALSKEFSLGFGLLVGSCCWIWPTGIVPSGSWRRLRSSPFLRCTS